MPRICSSIACAVVLLLGLALPVRAADGPLDHAASPPNGPSWLPIAAAGAAIVPGLGHYMLGDPTSALLDLGGVALPATLGSLNAAPTIFADLPDQRSSLWALTAQEAWFVQIYTTYSDARRKIGNAGFPQPLRPRTAWELLAAPFQPAQLFDWRVWATVGAGLAEDIAIETAMPDPPTPDTPSALQARYATLYGLRVSPATAYGASVIGGGVLAGHAGVGEEALFRGVIQDELERDIGPWGAIAGASSLFGLSHVGGINQTSAFKQFLSPGLFGAGLGVLYQSSGYDLDKCVAAHTYYDLIAFALSSLYPLEKGNNVFGIGYTF